MSEDRRFELMRARDTLSLARVLHPGLYYLHSNGLAEDYRLHLQQVGSGAIQYARMEVLDRQIRRMGRRAFVNGKLRVSGQYQLRDFDIKLQYSATYERYRSKIWRLLYWQSTKLAD
ncbi:MAG: nuclear transport factor 2 family protein [Saprospiraceae bacterium]